MTFLCYCKITFALINLPKTAVRDLEAGLGGGGGDLSTVGFRVRGLEFGVRGYGLGV